MMTAAIINTILKFVLPLLVVTSIWVFFAFFPFKKKKIEKKYPEARKEARVFYLDETEEKISGLS